jgi:hypothetical protein
LIVNVMMVVELHQWIGADVAASVFHQ